MYSIGIIEDGVEVVINHLEPYKIRGEQNSVQLEKDITIDTENDEIAEIGLNDIWRFDVDPEGNVYMVYLQSTENCIFKFDKYGSFLRSFGRKGQGPGELQYPIFLQVIDKRIVVSDITKLVFFGEDGKVINEISKESNRLFYIFMKNGNSLARERVRDASDPANQHVGLVLYDPEFNKIKEISRVTVPNPLKGKGYNVILPYSHAHITGELLYAGNSERGYVISIFDQNGNPIKRIKKQYAPVPVNDEDKKRILKTFERMPEEIKKTFYFPDNYPPFQRHFFTDDQGRLFVMTYEKGNNPREFMYDIFNADGAFVGRIGLNNYGQSGARLVPLPALSKNNRLYLVREKETGFKELAVYTMTWQ